MPTIEDGLNPSRRSRRGHHEPRGLSHGWTSQGKTCVFCGTVTDPDGEGSQFGCPYCQGSLGGSRAAKDVPDAAKRLGLKILQS